MALVQRKLGKTDLEVSVIGLGTVKFGRNQGVKNKTSDGFALPEDSQIEKLLGICRDEGLTLLDTAPAYGVAEERLGKLLGTSRKEFIISSKAGESFNGESSTYDFSADAITKSVENSLRTLKTDYIDSILLHCPRDDMDVLKNTPALETLAKLKKKGNIRAFGASTHTIEAGLYACTLCDILMVPYNPEYTEHLPVIKLAEDFECGILIKKGLYSGHIDETNPKESLFNCFHSALSHQSASSLVAGTISEKHLIENIRLANKAMKLINNNEKNKAS